MASVTDQLAAEKAAATPTTWEQWITKVFGAERGAQILARKVCATCQGKLKIQRVYTKGAGSVAEWTCGRCGRIAAQEHVAPVPGVLEGS